jgi:hypothetical protein
MTDLHDFVGLSQHTRVHGRRWPFAKPGRDPTGSCRELKRRRRRDRRRDRDRAGDPLVGPRHVVAQSLIGASPPVGDVLGTSNVQAGRSRRRARASQAARKGNHGRDRDCRDDHRRRKRGAAARDGHGGVDPAARQLRLGRGGAAREGRRTAQSPSGHLRRGEETTPERDAEERSEHLGTFAAGEETMPEKDAAERGHPGTFADTEPQE